MGHYEIIGLDEQESNKLNDFTFRFDLQNFFHENDNMMQSLPDTDVNSWLEVVQHLSDPQAQTDCRPFCSKAVQKNWHWHWGPFFQQPIDTHTVPAFWKKSITTPMSKRPWATGNNDFPRDKWQTDDPEVIKNQIICLHINIQVSTQTHTDNLCNRAARSC